MREAIRGAGQRGHVLLATMTLCGLTRPEELLFPRALDLPSCGNCDRKLSALQARSRKANARERRRERRAA